MVTRAIELFVRVHTRALAIPAYLVLFAAWLFVGQSVGFDRYPFQFLTLVVSLLAIILSLGTLLTAGSIEAQTRDSLARIEEMETRILRAIDRGCDDGNS